MKKGEKNQPLPFQGQRLADTAGRWGSLFVAFAPTGVVTEVLAVVAVGMFATGTVLAFHGLVEFRRLGGFAAVLGLLVVLRLRGFRLPIVRGMEPARPLLSQAAPLVAHAILGLVIFNSDLIFLRALKDARTAGMYAAAYTLVSFLLNLGVTYGNSLLPVFTRLGADTAGQRRLFDDATVQVLAVALPLAVGGGLLAGGLMGTVFGGAYLASVPALQILIFSVIAAYVRTVVQMALIARNEQAFVLRTTAWSAAANLALNVVLIPRFGMAGAASATLATEVLRTVIALVYASRLGLPFGAAPRLWRPVAGTLVMSLLLVLVPMPNAVLAVVCGALAYAAVLAATGGLRVREGRIVLTV